MILFHVSPGKGREVTVKMKVKLKFNVLLISLVFILAACDSVAQKMKPVSEEVIHVLPGNPYGENYSEEKTLFLSPVDNDLLPIPELHLRNGEMESFRIVYPANAETKVRSVSVGTVVKIQNKRPPEMSEDELELSMLGKYAIIDIGNGVSIRYAHLSNVTVKEGDTVSMGDEIGIVGYSGMALLNSKQPICGIYVLEGGLQVNPLQYFQMPEKFVISVT